MRKGEKKATDRLHRSSCEYDASNLVDDVLEGIRGVEQEVFECNDGLLVVHRARRRRVGADKDSTVGVRVREGEEEGLKLVHGRDGGVTSRGRRSRGFDGHSSPRRKGESVSEDQTPGNEGKRRDALFASSSSSSFSLYPLTFTAILLSFKYLTTSSRLT